MTSTERRFALDSEKRRRISFIAAGFVYVVGFAITFLYLISHGWADNLDPIGAMIGGAVVGIVPGGITFLAMTTMLALILGTDGESLLAMERIVTNLCALMVSIVAGAVSESIAIGCVVFAIATLLIVRLSKYLEPRSFTSS